VRTLWFVNTLSPLQSARKSLTIRKSQSTASSNEPTAGEFLRGYEIVRKSLYEILGVDPKASAEDIEAAYHQRVEEFAHATIADPNKLRILKQALDILSDANERAAYDTSLSAPRVARVQVTEDEEPEPGFLQGWGKWLILVLILVGIGAWWTRQDSSPPAQPPVSPQATETAELEPIEPAEEPIVEEPSPADAAPPPDQASAGQADAPAPPTPAPTNPIIGRWSCFDPISGRSGNYAFNPDGTLTVDWADGQAISQNYQISGKLVRLPDAQPAITYTIEQLATERMILNIGQGRRLVCTR
jgi:outer membrane biosynthesis protein TonB